MNFFHFFLSDEDN